MARKKLPVGFEPIEGLSWLAAAGVDTEAIMAEWTGSAKGEYVREAIIKRVIDRHGLRNALMNHARKLLEKAIA